MSVEIPDIPFVNSELELEHMVKPLQLWFKQMAKKKWQFEASPDGILQYSVLPSDNNQRFARFVIFIKKPKRLVADSFFDIPLMKSFQPNVTEMKILLESGDVYLNYEIQQLPYGSLTVPRDFLFVQSNYKSEGDQYVVMSSVNSEKANVFNENLVRGYKKMGIRIYDEKPNESTNIEVIVCADLRGWVIGYVVNKFMFEQVEPFVLLKNYLEKDEREAEMKRKMEEEEMKKQQEEKMAEVKKKEEEKRRIEEEKAKQEELARKKKQQEDEQKRLELEKRKRDDDKQKEEELKKKKEHDEQKKKEDDEQKKKIEKEKKKKVEQKQKEDEQRKQEKKKEAEKKKKDDDKKKKAKK